MIRAMNILGQFLRILVGRGHFLINYHHLNCYHLSLGVRGLSIDPFREEIYWTDVTSDLIEMVKYDGTGRRMVLSLPSNDPWAIVVHPERR